jgi:uncharacterized protein (TIGR03437 family)
MRQLGIILGVFALGAGTVFAQSTGNNPITITNSPPGGSIGTAYVFQFTASGGTAPYTWFLNTDLGGPLPPGLSMTQGGAISGTPTATGNEPKTYQIAVDVNDAAMNFGSGSFQITISPCSPTVSPSSPLPNGEVGGINYSQTFSASGCAGAQYTFDTSPSNPVPGLHMSPSGVLSGQPSQAGVYTFNVAVFDSNARLVANPPYSLTVVAAPAITTTSPLPNGIVGLPYGPVPIMVTGGTTPYSFSRRNFPPGLTMDGNGVISGTPTTAGTFTLYVTVTDHATISTPEVSFTLTVTAANPLLQVSPSSLTFLAPAGGDAPPPEAISVIPAAGAQGSFAFTIMVDGGQTGSAAPSWLSVQPTSGTAPALLTVTADQGTLQAGANTGRIRVIDTNNLESDVSVTLTVTAGASQLLVAPSGLHFASLVQSPGTFVQDLAITSGGGGGTLAFGTSIVNGSSWITNITPRGGQTTRNSPVLMQIQVNTQGLAVGSYHDVVQVSSPAGNVSVPISLFVSASGPVLGVNVTGLRFPAQVGGGPANPQAIKVLDLGDPTSTVNWTASILSGSDWLSLANTGRTATTSTPGILNLAPNDTSAFPAGGRYALIQISDPLSLNSPQYLVAVLDLQPSSAPPLPDPAPAGLFFTAVASGAQTSAQTVNVRTTSTTAVPFQAAASTTDGAAWLKIAIGTATSTSSTPGAISVSVDPSKLTAGIYTGSVNISMSGVVRTVNITVVVLPGTGTTSSTAVHSELVQDAAAACTPAKLALTETGLANNFSVPAAWPATLIAQLNDDCGAAVNNGSVIASFSNGDPPLTLRGDALGGYSATWQPGVVGPQLVVTLNATSGALQPATAKLVGGISQNTAPTLSHGGEVNAFFRTAGALAPGTDAEVYGTGLASAASGTGLPPYPTTFQGTQVLVGGLSAPLTFVSGGQVNVEIPAELKPTQQYAVVVSANGALTLPDTIDLAPTVPGVLTYSDSVHAHAQHLNGSDVTATSPAKPGEYVVIYLLGMGPTNPSVPSNAPAPSSEPLARVTIAPAVTLDGANTSVLYAGLTPFFVGLYQIDFQVPQNARSGDLNLVIMQGSVTANTTKLTVSQ